MIVGGGKNVTYELEVVPMLQRPNAVVVGLHHHWVDKVGAIGQPGQGDDAPPGQDFVHRA